MATEELLRGIHRTLDRIDARHEQSERRWEEEQRRWEERDRRWEERDREHKEMLAEHRELLGEHREALTENRRFNDEILRRHATITQEMISQLQGMQAEIADGREQIQANTRAVLQVLDRYPPPGQG